MYDLKILSLGAGVQSSTILLMCEKGLLPKIDAAVFSDTGWESQATYDWLEHLRTLAPSIPIIVTGKKSIRDDMYEAQVRGLKKDGVRWANMPFFTRDRSSGKLGMLRRQCTEEYKIRPIRKEIRGMLGLKPRQRAPLDCVEQWVGISTDEAHRVWARKKDRFSVIRYPLLDITPMSRTDCVNWLMQNYGVVPPKSACVGCPFRHNKEWRMLPKDEFKSACEFDEMIRVRGGMRGDLYLHDSRKPLIEVDFRTAEDRGQLCLDFAKDEKISLFVRKISIIEPEEDDYA